MFCNQCEQTSKGVSCTTAGVCGKKSETASLQDLLGFVLRGVAFYADQVKGNETEVADNHHFILKALFATLTNVNFDEEAIAELIREAGKRKAALRMLGNSSIESSEDPAVAFSPAQTISEMVVQGERLARLDQLTQSEDVASLKQLLLYGIRGVAAYAYHAWLLGKEGASVYTFINEALQAIGNPSLGVDELLPLVLQCGAVNYTAMELLDAGNVEKFGHPEPTEISLGQKAGKCILVSGHELLDLLDLLEATEGTGINVYTHGEMLPAHAYPNLKRFAHLAGHYGTAWQNQKQEFDAFPGAILMTTNCIQEPKNTYIDRIFTTGPVGWSGVKHLPNGRFQALIEKAQALPGFTEDQPGETVMAGFARNAVLGVADKIIEAVKQGAIKHFFLVAGCDGAKPGRNYYTEFVEKAPADTVVLTLACGKFRFFDKKLGDIGGIPRLLDVGQCSDAYSAIQIALALAEAFDCGVNDLPLSMVLSWYEQKAVSILLTLLHLGIKDIRLGPSLPAFISPNVLNILVENYGIKPITTADQDLADILGTATH